MYAIVETGGKQYQAEVGQMLEVELLGGDSGDPVEFNRVLLLKDDSGTRVGTPTVEGAVVRGQIADTIRGKKVIIFKMRRRKNYRLKKGHRQNYHRVLITAIEAQ